MLEKLVATDAGGITYIPASRWIKIHNEVITSRSKFWDYGYPCDGINWDDNCREIDYFQYNGRKYPIDQFLRLTYPILYEDKEGKSGVIGGYDCTDWYHPMLLEIHPDGEYVKLWKEVH